MSLNTSTNFSGLTIDNVDINVGMELRQCFYNRAGMNRFYEGMHEADVRSDGTGYNGVDIGWVTDSIPLYEAYTFRSDVAAAVFRDLIQRHNPVMREDGSREGGLGYVPTNGAFASWNLNDPRDGGLAADAIWSYEAGGFVPVDSTVQYSDCNAPSGAKRIRIEFDGTHVRSIANRSRITGFEFLPRIQSGFATATYDRFGVTGFGAIGGGTQTGTIVTAGATNYAAHTGIVISGLTATNLNVIQLSCPNGGRIILPGGIAFYDDEDKGFRVHTLGNPGVRLALYGNNELTAVLDNFGAATGVGATNLKLVVGNHLLNDELSDNGTTETVNTWEALLDAFVTRIENLDSRSCYLHVISPPGSNATRQRLHPVYIKAIKRVMNRHRQTMSVLDLCQFLGGGVDGATNSSVYTGLFNTLGFSRGDGSHGNDKWMKFYGRIVYLALMGGKMG
jgi:hypothetical protein